MFQNVVILFDFFIYFKPNIMQSTMLDGVNTYTRNQSASSLCNSVYRHVQYNDNFVGAIYIFIRTTWNLFKH